MTTQRQIEANRRNAGKSTGPRTAAGKAIASRNATRHAMTARPKADAVLAWLKAIGEPLQQLPPQQLSDQGHAALNLAAAEARLQQARHGCEQLQLQYEREGGITGAVDKCLLLELEIMFEAGEEFGWDRQGREILARITRSRRNYETRILSVGHDARLARRYLAEAEAQQEKAMRRWLDGKTAENETKPFST